MPLRRLFARRPHGVPIGPVSFTVCFRADATRLAGIGPARWFGHARAVTLWVVDALA